MNPDLSLLQPYPFEKLAALKRSVTIADGITPIDISIGEPKHAVPSLVRDAMAEQLTRGIALYPTTRGQESLRRAIADWLTTRFQLTPGSVDPARNVLSANGTREALFSVAMAVIDRTAADPVVLTPNPFYQIYEGASLISGARIVPVPATAENGFVPDYAALPAELLDKTQLLYLCSPSNPTGAVHDLENLKQLIRLADRHDFVLCSDECYSEIWYDRPPAGLLEACRALGREDFKRCLVFHSLSKRSNMPGARTGFIAGDGEILDAFFRLRTYTGCATPPFIQEAAVTAWGDEQHVADNRALYGAKLDDAVEILSPVLTVRRPDAGFYLWLEVPGGGEAFARRLYQEQGVTTLPGGYLGRPSADGSNPGDPYIRIALVSERERNREAMHRIALCAR
ncbi:MAG: succinyldiaminopimelate transaminase [Magnetococcales bacterium]|nr:succinyldiaminopimelate transaminase [Magnetococcales bacterium]